MRQQRFIWKGPVHRGCGRRYDFVRLYHGTVSNYTRIHQAFQPRNRASMTRYGLLTMLDERPGQRSFHVASEKHVRVEFMRFAAGQQLGPLNFEGDAVVTCLEGSFLVGDDAQPAAAL